MGSPSKGAISGAIAGLVYGGIFAAVGYLTLLSTRAAIIEGIVRNLPANSSYTPDQLFNSALMTTPFIALLVGIAGGVVLGSFYGWFFEKIPGRGSVVRGLVFGLVFWFFFSVIGGLGNIEYGVGYYAFESAIGLVTALLFGWLLGYSYGRLVLRDDAGSLA